MELLQGNSYCLGRGGAYAFKLDILTKLTELKTNDNKKTLMFYLVENIAENDEKLLEITKYLDRLSDSIILINYSELTRNK